jgi:hypothetical protein
MKNIEMIQKFSVLQCVYQMIASSDGAVVGNRDNQAIDYAISKLGLTSNFSWNTASNLNSNESFKHVVKLDFLQKQQFRSLLLTIAEMSANTVYRKNCAYQLFQLTN